MYESNPTSNFRGIQIRIQIYLQYRFFRFSLLSERWCTPGHSCKILIHYNIILIQNCMFRCNTNRLYLHERKKKGDYIEFHFLYSPIGINQIMIFFITYYLSNYFGVKGIYRNVYKVRH